MCAGWPRAGPGMSSFRLPLSHVWSAVGSRVAGRSLKPGSHDSVHSVHPDGHADNLSGREVQPLVTGLAITGRLPPSSVPLAPMA